MNIRLHIERLVLDGSYVSPADGPRVQTAIEAELMRLLATGGMNSGLQAGMAFPSIRVGDMQFTSDISPTQLGQQIANALYRGLGQ